MSMESGFARRMWHHFEAIHAYFYYAPEVFGRAESLGYAVDTRWPSYFAWRAAPLGAAGRASVASAFYSFSPAMVAEHVPNAWQTADPSVVLAARAEAVDEAFRKLLGDAVDSAGLAEAAALARLAAEAALTAGRPLAAANADLPWPDAPHAVLWHALTLLREHRGDGHIAALLSAGLDPCESLVSFASVGAASVETFASRGWTADEWAAAQERLVSRGWIDGDGQATEFGHEGRDRVELLTDLAALGPWLALGAEASERLITVVMAVLVAVLQSGLLPSENTLGIGRVTAPSN